MKKNIVLLTAALIAHSAFALINPNFTPIHLTKQSDIIMRVDIQDAIADDGALTLLSKKMLKGNQYDLRLKLSAETRKAFNAMEYFIGDYDSFDALVFITQTKDNTELGNIYFEGDWYLFSQAEDGTWDIKEDKNTVAIMKTVWDGSLLMLDSCIHYILNDSAADVPCTAAGKWKNAITIGQIPGLCAALHSVRLSENRPLLIALSSEGDKAFEIKNGIGTDLTENLKLASQSHSMAFADVNKDGRLDILSLNETSLSVHLQSESGTFEKTQKLSAIKNAKTIALIDLGSSQNTGILISTDQNPELLTLSAKLETVQKPIPAPSNAGKPRNSLVADFDGDSINDILIPFEESIALFKGDGKGNFTPIESECGYSEGDQPKTHIGDFDADGNFDTFFSFKNGSPTIWINRSNATTFFDNGDELGESDYSAKPKQTGSTIGDFDGDGRQDFLLFYEKTGMQGYFSRGFATFGYSAGDIDPINLLKESSMGQQCGIITDLDNDGATDIAVVLSNGSILGMLIECNDNQNLMVKVQLPASFTSPLKIIGYDDQRCLGARNIYPGIPAYFAKREAGPITLKWKYPNGKEQEEEIILMDGCIEYQLNIDGCEEL